MTWPQGVLFRLTKDGTVRSVYEQCDGEIVLADTCKCRVDWIVDSIALASLDSDFRHMAPTKMTVIRSIDCPIDEHKAKVLAELQRREDFSPNGDATTPGYFRTPPESAVDSDSRKARIVPVQENKRT